MLGERTKCLELFRISWHDPITHTSWCSDREALNKQPGLCSTVGWFVNRDDKCLRLAMHYNNDGEWSDIFLVPLGCLAEEPEKVSEITVCLTTVPAEAA